MLIYDLIVFFVFVGLLLLTTPLLGNYIARIFSSDLLPGESLIYRLLGVDYKKEMSWVVYAIHLLFFNIFGIKGSYSITLFNGVRK
jgi:K+-transporting ATPase A subunit